MLVSIVYKTVHRVPYVSLAYGIYYWWIHKVVSRLNPSLEYCIARVVKMESWNMEFFSVHLQESFISLLKYLVQKILDEDCSTLVGFHEDIL